MGLLLRRRPGFTGGFRAAIGSRIAKGIACGGACTTRNKHGRERQCIGLGNFVVSISYGILPTGHLCAGRAAQTALSRSCVNRGLSTDRGCFLTWPNRGPSTFTTPSSERQYGCSFTAVSTSKVSSDTFACTAFTTRLTSTAWHCSTGPPDHVPQSRSTHGKQPPRAIPTSHLRNKLREEGRSSDFGCRRR